MANISQINGLLINAATASLATTASFALAVAGGGGGAAFPYTGSAIISGSLTVTGSTNINGALNATSITSSFTGALTGTASFASTASFVNTLRQNLTVSGSLTITNDLIVLGSASITNISQSTLNIGTNLITVNTNTPSTRFGGLAVIDSGSSPQRSGSILFDSTNDQWLFVHQTAGITSSLFIMGPETYNNIGNETNLTTNKIPKSTNAEHIGDSNISDTGTVVSINSNTQITGSLIVSNGITGSLFGTASYALASAGGGGGGDTTAIEAQFYFLM